MPIRLRQASDMFPNYGIMSEFLNEFYVMDVVVLNGALSPTAAVDEEKQNVDKREADPDGVVTDYCVGLFSATTKMAQLWSLMFSPARMQLNGHMYILH